MAHLPAFMWLLIAAAAAAWRHRQQPCLPRSSAADAAAGSAANGWVGTCYSLACACTVDTLDRTAWQLGRRASWIEHRGSTGRSRSTCSHCCNSSWQLCVQLCTAAAWGGAYSLRGGHTLLCLGVHVCLCCSCFSGIAGKSLPKAVVSMLSLVTAVCKRAPLVLGKCT
jgi:hypothetical protein